MKLRTNICLVMVLAFVLGPLTAHARYLNASTGRFQTMDSYEGNNSDPLTLHKYLYAHDDPLNRIDPSGKFSVVETMAGLFTRYKIHAAIIAGGTFTVVHAYWHIKGRSLSGPEKKKVDDAIAVLRDARLNGEYLEYADLLDSTHIKIDRNQTLYGYVPGFSARVIFLDESIVSYEKEILAATLLHEAVHVQQWFITFRNKTAIERPALLKENEFLILYGIHGYAEDLSRTYPIAGSGGWFHDTADSFWEFHIENPAVTVRGGSQSP